MKFSGYFLSAVWKCWYKVIATCNKVTKESAFKSGYKLKKCSCVKLIIFYLLCVNYLQFTILATVVILHILHLPSSNRFNNCIRAATFEPNIYTRDDIFTKVISIDSSLQTCSWRMLSLFIVHFHSEL